MTEKHKTKKYFKGTSGITLIALVVTIIVLLILAGISIQMLTGNNGILTRAGEAKKETEEKSIFENIGLAYNSGKIEKYAGTKTLSETMEEELVAIYGAENVEVKDNGDDTYIVTVNGTKYNISDGQIEKIDPVVNPYDPNAWEKAWVYPTNEGKWSDEIQKNGSLPENYEIIAKLYKVNESDENYSLVIEGEGEMPTVIDSIEETIGYAWQTNIQENEDGLVENPNDIGTIYVCDGITNIGNMAFIGCTNLENIKISTSVTSIGWSAFACCTGLTSINIPNSVTRIGEVAFYYCTGLTSINIPSSVTRIGERAFYYCTGLTSINIPDGVTSIEDWAFAYCTSLTSINIPSSVTRIGEAAFGACGSLTSINIPKGVTSIKNGAFSTCTSLISVNIPDSVTSIEDWAFDSCMSLTNIKIPDSVTSIGTKALSYCTALKEIKLSKNVESINLNSWMGVQYTEITEVTDDNYDLKVSWRGNDYYFVKQ